MTIEQVCKWLCIGAAFVLVCLGLAERGDGAEVTIEAMPKMYWDDKGQLHNPGLLNPYPQRWRVEVEDEVEIHRFDRHNRLRLDPELDYPPGVRR